MAIATSRVRDTTGKHAAVSWSVIYARWLFLSDAMVVSGVVFSVQAGWLGLDSSAEANTNNLRLSYTAISVIVITAWLVALAFYGSRKSKIIGLGSAEYRVISDVSVKVFGLFAIAAYLLHIELARGYMLIAFPTGTLFLLVSRWLSRRWLVAQRRRGKFCANVIIVGSVVSVRRVAYQLERYPAAGYRVCGVAVSTGHVGRLSGSELYSYGGFDALEHALDASGADTVVVSGSDDLTPERIRAISWMLEPERKNLVVVPGLVDIGGPRINTRPVPGLPLLHVEIPEFNGPRLYVKRLFDFVLAAALLTIIFPLGILIAILIKLDSPGKVIFWQNRVGLNGTPFRIAKFRSMVDGAELRLQDIKKEFEVDGTVPLFKMSNDPRITRVGKFMRKHSLDELPQLINVLRGDMSLVGPRPPLPDEVARYGGDVHRRLLVKPGMTGLWQVSGRSDLSWEDGVRLDLYYVENWSMIGDSVILWRTLKAVLGGVGAY